MKLSEIANRLQQFIPLTTDLFSETASISSISSTGSLATITTSENHNLIDGAVARLVGVETRTPIISVSTNGFIHTFTTSSDHDLTEGNPSSIEVPLEGFADPQWNDLFKLVSVPNRRTFSVSSTLASPALNGNENLLEPDRLDGINGIFQVSVVSNKVFTISGDFPTGDLSPIRGAVKLTPRVGVSIDGARAKAIFDKDPKKFWLFVLPAPTVVSKDRSSFSDAVTAQAQGTTLRLKLLDAFTVVIFAPVQDQLSAEQALDICQHDLRLPIIKALFGYKPSSGLSCETSEYNIVPTGHAIEDYDSAVLAYAYEFQSPVDLIADDALLDWRGSRAFRDIDLDKTGEFDEVSAGINLDDTPL